MSDVQDTCPDCLKPIEFFIIGGKLVRRVPGHRNTEHVCEMAQHVKTIRHTGRPQLRPLPERQGPRNYLILPPRFRPKDR